jgi:hypothetical protein
VVGVFRDREQARDALAALKGEGFPPDGISFLSPGPAEPEMVAEDAGSNVTGGLVTGGVFGGLMGWLLGMAALAIPGVGPFVAAGVLATTVTGAALGAGIGAIGGALTDFGMEQEQATWYANEVRGGATLVTVRADGRRDEAEAILRAMGAYELAAASRE